MNGQQTVFNLHHEANLPERLIIALVVLPVCLHVAQDITMTLVQKDATNIGVCS
jgi:hypothetical protein